MQEELREKEQLNDKTTLSFVSLGCFKNLVDTEVLGGMLEKKDIKLVSPYEDSDWVVVNTCGFITKAKEESIDEILSALEKKDSGEIKHVAIMGCLTQRYFDDLKVEFKETDIIWGVNDLEELADQIAAKGNKTVKLKKSPEPTAATYQDKELFLYNEKHKRMLTTTPNVTFIKISEGCNMKCSFCAIPSIRGPFRSRPIESIVTEAKMFKQRGVEELNLVSQNSTYFGKDRTKGKSELPLLLEELSKIGFKGVRVLYLMPEETTDEIIEAFAHPTIIHYFDLPFQHVAAGVLKPMNRSGDSEKKLKLIRKIRRKYKDAVIRSSFIVGFPGETEEHYNELKEFAKKSRIERFGVFGYSDEDNTAAFEIKEKVEPYEIELRKEDLMDVSDSNIKKYNRKLVKAGEIIGFLPLGPWEGNSTIGRILSQGPETDGLTRVEVPFDDNYSMYPIRIIDFQHEMLLGELA